MTLDCPISLSAGVPDASQAASSSLQSALAPAPQPAAELRGWAGLQGSSFAGSSGKPVRAGSREDLEWVQFKQKNAANLIFIWEGQTLRSRADKCRQLCSCSLQRSSRARAPGRPWEVSGVKPGRHVPGKGSTSTTGRESAGEQRAWKGQTKSLSNALPQSAETARLNHDLPKLRLLQLAIFFF